MPPKCGASGTASTGYYFGNLLEETLGAKFNTLTGYKDGPEVDLAVEREEIHCRGISIETMFGREPLIGWFKNGFVRVLIQTGKKRDPRLRDVPTIWELMNEQKTPDAGKRLSTIILAAGAFGRPYISSPGLPPDRAKLLQSAFKKTLTDPDFQAQAKERKLDVDPGRRRRAGNASPRSDCPARRRRGTDETFAGKIAFTALANCAEKRLKS